MKLNSVYDKVKFFFRLPSALVAWEGLSPVFTHHIYMVAALESIRLLTYPHYCFVRLASHPASCTSAMMELMPCALTPAYGVASMPIHPGCHRPFLRS